MRNLAWVVAGVILLTGCLADSSKKNNDQSPWVTPRGAAAPLSQTEFERLSAENQYQVANKLLGTLFKGVPMDEFFDLGYGAKRLRPGEGAENFMDETRLAMTSTLPSVDRYAERVENRHTYSGRMENGDVAIRALAVTQEFPLSREQFEGWMAYHLANTILFSPAAEIDSASFVDAEHVYNGLLEALANSASIRDIIYTHMTSVANWRRFRSPEDNTREMIEIYLGLFDRDADVPRASTACKNWYLLDDQGDYELVIDKLNENDQPQNVLDGWVTTCEDFFRLIANHPLVIPRVTTVLVDRFFPTYEASRRAALIQDIVAANPVTFHDIFSAIIFSREYLLNNERPKRYEESYFNTKARLSGLSSRNYVQTITSLNRGRNKTLLNMGQPVMYMKLGQFKDQALDSLSFAHYHKALREDMLVRFNQNTYSSSAQGWSVDFLRKGDFLHGEEYVDYVLLSVLGRRATTEEQETFAQIFEEKELVDSANLNVRRDQTLLILEYASRLPETYFFRKIN